MNSVMQIPARKQGTAIVHATAYCVLSSTEHSALRCSANHTQHRPAAPSVAGTYDRCAAATRQPFRILSLLLTNGNSRSRHSVCLVDQ